LRSGIPGGTGEAAADATAPVKAAGKMAAPLKHRKNIRSYMNL